MFIDSDEYLPTTFQLQRSSYSVKGGGGIVMLADHDGLQIECYQTWFEALYFWIIICSCTEATDYEIARHKSGGRMLRCKYDIRPIC